MKYRAITSENFYYTDIKRTAKIVMGNKYSREELIKMIRVEYSLQSYYPMKYPCCSQMKGSILY